jgi:acid phosphatase family membrane protein YuiD
MEAVRNLLSNYVLTCAVLAWALAQVLKTILYVIVNKKFNAERLVGMGGMPSCHSAMVCALTIATARAEGVNSTIFAIAVMFATVVMYDAMGVRRAAGEQAKVLNRLVREDDEENLEKPLKEFLGHKPIEVLAGALLGILTAIVVPM